MGKFGTRMDSNASIKQMQSEMGVTGEHSPNIPLIVHCIDNLNDFFKMEKEELLVCHDSVLIVSMMHLGSKLTDPNEGASAIYGLRKGDINEVAAMLYAWLRSEKDMRLIVESVLMKIKIEEQTENMIRNLKGRLGVKEEEEEDE